MRILLAAGALQLLRSSDVYLLGQRVLLFDVGGAIGIAALLITFIVSAISEPTTSLSAGAVAAQGGSPGFANDRSILSDMILVAVDDFLFRSKIRTTGKQAGVELTFPSTPDDRSSRRVRSSLRWPSST